MIEHRAIERLGGRGEAPRSSAVTVARPRIATRMIVSQDDAGAAMRGRVEDDLADRESRAALVALVAGNVETTGVVVDMGDPEVLAPGISLGEATRKEAARRRETVELQRKFGTLIPHIRRLRDRAS